MAAEKPTLVYYCAGEHPSGVQNGCCCSCVDYAPVIEAALRVVSETPSRDAIHCLSAALKQVGVADD